jgi:hypothetical protein
VFCRVVDDVELLQYSAHISKVSVVHLITLSFNDADCYFFQRNIVEHYLLTLTHRQIFEQQNEERELGLVGEN